MLPFKCLAVAVAALITVGCTAAEPLPNENLILQLLAQDASSGEYQLQVEGVSYGALHLVTSDSHACFINPQRKVLCWGENDRGQLGHGTYSAQRTPLEVEGIEDAQVLALGKTHTCALVGTGEVYCWGDNVLKQVNTTAISSLYAPVKILDLPYRATNLVAGMYHTCARLEIGSLMCWGANGAGQLGTQLTDGVAPVVVSGMSEGVTNNITAGYLHTCAMMDTGDAKCWGSNTHGQVAPDVQDAVVEPVSLALPDTVKAISAGGNHTCALLADDTSSCWGLNNDGQLGEPVPTAGAHESDESSEPQEVGAADDPASLTEITEVSEILTGAAYTCISTESGDVTCWGAVDGFQRGDSPNLALY